MKKILKRNKQKQISKELAYESSESKVCLSTPASLFLVQSADADCFPGTGT